MSTSGDSKRPSTASKNSLLFSALSVITRDALHRSNVIYRRVSASPLPFVLAFLPKALASPSVPQNSGNPFPDSTGNLSDPAVLEDVNFLVLLFDWKNWTGTAGGIRDGTNRSQCLANLNLALQVIGPLENAEMSGSSGALTLLPTAGALIGAPTKELWVVYKLMPIAGILSMLLSLGGNIVPTEASDYELGGKAFSYGGMIATIQQDEEESDEFEERLKHTTLSDAQKFAARVEVRSKDMRGGQRYLKVWYGIVLQCFWLAIVLGACWFTQSGSVVVWWCKAWGWMFFWYLMVAGSSLLENFASVPFTRQWTLRISRAPKVRISDDAPPIISRSLSQYPPKPSQSQPDQFQQKDFQKPLPQPHPYPDDDEITPQTLSRPPTLTLLSDPLPPLKHSYIAATTNTATEKPRLTSTNSTSSANLNTYTSIPLLHPTSSYRDTRVLDALEAGFNTRGRIALARHEPYSASRVPFYAIVSLEGVSTAHAVLRVVSKAITVGVFAAGTAIFAAAQMITISVALTVLCLVLGAGVFGRVIAMYMASEMMKTKPVLHKVVKSRGVAAEYIEAVLAVEGLVVEVMGHVIVDGRVVGRYSQWASWSAWAGVLAGPFDLGSLATRE